MPKFDHEGRMMPRVAAIRTDLVAMSRNQYPKEYARKLARFRQHLLPHTTVARIFSVWKESPTNANAHRQIPDDLDLQKVALAGLINRTLDQRWAMIADAHVSYRLYRLYRRLVARALEHIPDAVGNPDLRAKTNARLELVTAIYGTNLTYPSRNHKVWRDCTGPPSLWQRPPDAHPVHCDHAAQEGRRHGIPGPRGNPVRAARASFI